MNRSFSCCSYSCKRTRNTYVLNKVSDCFWDYFHKVAIMRTWNNQVQLKRAVIFEWNWKNINSPSIFEEFVLNNRKCPVAKTLAIVFQILSRRIAARIKIVGWMIHRYKINSLSSAFILIEKSMNLGILPSISTHVPPTGINRPKLIKCFISL